METYGVGVAHVNLAAVLTSLGSSCFAEKKFDEARDYLWKSLLMRRKIYGVNDDEDGSGSGSGVSAGDIHGVSSNNNVEIAMNLCKLGEVERAAGNQDVAMIFFKKSRLVYDMLLFRECNKLAGCVNVDGSTCCRAKLLHLLSSISPSSRSFSSSLLIFRKLLQLSINVANWERKLAKVIGDLKREELVSEELVQMRAALGVCSKADDTIISESSSLISSSIPSSAAVSSFSSPSLMTGDHETVSSKNFLGLTTLKNHKFNSPIPSVSF